MSLAWTLAELAQALEAEASGPPNLVLAGVCSLEEPKPDALTFVETERLAARLQDCAAGAFIVPAGVTLDRPTLTVANPRLAFARAVGLFHPPRPVRPGVHSSAIVSPEAEVDPGAEVGPFCVVGPGARVAGGARLVAQVAVGADCRIEAGTEVGPAVRLGRAVHLGAGCLLDPGSVLGDEVRLGEKVYLGARSLLETGVEVGTGSKLDNLVRVGAQARLGRGCLVISQALVGARACLGDYCVVAGQAQVADGVELAAQVQVAGRAVVTTSCARTGEALGGDPAGPLRQELKQRADRARVPELVDWIRRRRSECSTSTS